MKLPSAGCARLAVACLVLPPLLAFSVTPALAAPQQPEPPPASPTPAAGAVLAGAIEAQGANLDVVVTDAKGEPVSGLKREDFQLFQDGKPVAVTRFAAIAGEAPGKPAGATPARAGAPLAEAQRLYLVVFVDSAHLSPEGRKRALRQVESFLEKNVGQDDRVLVASYDPGLKIRRSFTETARPLAQDFEALTRSPAQGPVADDNRRSVLRGLEKLGCTPEAQEKVRSYARQEQDGAEETVSTLRRFVDALAGLEGRKAVLYLSDGFPLRPGVDVAEFLETLCELEATKAPPIASLAEELQSLTQAAGAARITFYPLEAAGLRLPGVDSALDPSPFRSRPGARNALPPGRGAAKDEPRARSAAPVLRAGGRLGLVERSNLQDSLRALAQDTGGKSVLDTNDLGRGLQAIGAELRHAYALGFSPDPADSGREHEMKVEVAKPGLTVRARTRFVSAPPEERRRAALEAALWFGIEANPLAVRLSLGEAELEEGGGFLVPLELKLPLRSVTLLAEEERQRGRLEVQVVSRDAEGRADEPQLFEIPLDLSADQAKAGAKTVLRHEVSLRLPAGETVIAVSVHDEEGGGTSYLRQAARIGPPDSAAQPDLGARKPQGH